MADALGMYYAYKIIKLMSTPWNKWHAFELGLIDEKGKTLRKASSPEEKEAMGKFGILVRNLKRILERLPFGKTRTASLAAALYLLKESETRKYDMEAVAYKVMKEINNGVATCDMSDTMVCEDTHPKGVMEVNESIINNCVETDDTFLGFIVYEGKDLLTGKKITFLKESINE